MSALKLCKDCRFVRLHATNPGEYSECLKGMRVNPVTGELDLPTQSTRYAVLLRQRDRPGDCGVDGQFFQHKNLSIVPSSPDPVPA